MRRVGEVQRLRAAVNGSVVSLRCSITAGFGGCFGAGCHDEQPEAGLDRRDAGRRQQVMAGTPDGER